jgi:hypothetical protein
MPHRRTQHTLAVIARPQPFLHVVEGWYGCNSNKLAVQRLTRTGPGNSCPPLACILQRLLPGTLRPVGDLSNGLALLLIFEVSNVFSRKEITEETGHVGDCALRCQLVVVECNADFVGVSCTPSRWQSDVTPKTRLWFRPFHGR